MLAIKSQSSSLLRQLHRWGWIAILLGLSHSASAKELEDDTGWWVFQIVYPEGKEEGGLKLSSLSDKAVSYRRRIWKGEENGQPVTFLQKEDATSDATRVLWTFTLEPDGAWLTVLQKEIFDPQNHLVGKTVYDYRSAMWSFPKKLCHTFSLAAAMTQMPFNVDEKIDFHILLSEEANPWRLFLEVEDVEKITVPAGEFECYRLSLEPDYDDIMGSWSWASTLIRPFVPDYKFWVLKEAPHHLIRFEGQMGPVGGSSIQVHELVEIQPIPKPQMSAPNPAPASTQPQDKL